MPTPEKHATSHRHPKNQHYVPKFLLDRFADPATGQVFAFDKLTGKSFATSSRNIGSENRFYDLAVDGALVSLEPALQELDGEAAGAISRLVERPNTKVITDADRNILARFIAVQLARGPHVRAQLRQMHDKLFRTLAAESEAETEQFTANQIKAIALEHLSNAPQFVPLLLNKLWLLHRAPEGSHCFTSDNPATLDNLPSKNGFWPGTGLACEGIQIHLPLSYDLVLVLYCRSYEASWRISQAQAQVLQAHGVKLTGPTGSKAAFDATVQAMNDGRPIEVSKEVISRENELQILFAERFLFASRDDFSLARKKIEAFPDLKSGRKLT